ncbi:MAG: tripartite tricarboxylate transporter substrate binding protein [Burkholderiaceae bacterium]
MQQFSFVRRVLALVAACLAALALSTGAAHAQGWPSRQPIRIVIPYPPGGASDVTARTLAAKLTDALGQSVVVENRPGANGIVALELVAKSPADGYTLLMANLGPNAINPVVYKKLPYDAVKDFTPIMLTTLVPLVLVVNPELPVKDLPSLIAMARQSPGKLDFASAGNGASNHLAGELFNSMADIKTTHVPYKGDSPAMSDVIGGQVAMMFPTAIAAMPHLKSGKLRALAVTSAKRVPSLPDVPTMSEAGVPGFEAVSWGGLMGPGNLPPEIVARLNTELQTILKMPDVVEKLQSLGAEVVATSPQAFATYLQAEIDKWGKVARGAGVQLD